MKHSWGYNPRALPDNAKIKSSEVEIILDKRLKNQTMITMGESVIDYASDCYVGYYLYKTTRIHRVVARLLSNSQTPFDVKLIRLRYVYKLMKDWTSQSLKCSLIIC